MNIYDLVARGGFYGIIRNRRSVGQSTPPVTPPVVDNSLITDDEVPITMDAEDGGPGTGETILTDE